MNLNRLVNPLVPFQGDDGGVKYKFEQESFYLLSFQSWLHNFRDLERWENRAANFGVFALISCCLLIGQMITLFDLAYEENLAHYRCQGDAARPSVVVCGILVTIIVVLKMLPEERRCFGQRLVLIRHGAEFSFYNSISTILFGEKKHRAFLILCTAIFHNFRVFGVVTFVYVAAIEQLMMEETALDYIINAVVVLVIAEVDELAFLSLSRIEMSEEHEHHSRLLSASSHNNNNNDDSTHHHDHQQQQQQQDEQLALLSASSCHQQGHEGLEHSHHHSSDSVDVECPSVQGGIASQQPHSAQANSPPPRSAKTEHHVQEYSSLPSTRRLSNDESSVAHNMHEMTRLVLNKRERDVFKIYDYAIMLCNVFALVLPLTHGKITGMNCSTHSRLRVSEIGMIFLMCSRVMLNVYVDFFIVKHKFVSYWQALRHCVWSMLEHGLPCFLYVLLMYYVFVDALKPPTDDSA